MSKNILYGILAIILFILIGYFGLGLGSVWSSMPVCSQGDTCNDLIKSYPDRTLLPPTTDPYYGCNPSDPAYDWLKGRYFLQIHYYTPDGIESASDCALVLRTGMPVIAWTRRINMSEYGTWNAKVEYFSSSGCTTWPIPNCWTSNMIAPTPFKTTNVPWNNIAPPIDENSSNSKEPSIWINILIPIFLTLIIGGFVFYKVKR